MMRAGGRWLATVALAAGAGCAVPADLAAQRAADVASGCASVTGAPTPCADAALGARGLAADLTLLAGLGSEVSGTATTLGQRLAAGPRIAVGVRAGGARVRLPALDGSGAVGSRSVTATTIHFDVAAGLFDGFRLMPTVGGFLSLDAAARVSLVHMPSDVGLDDGSMEAFSFGLRIGLLRESFTLPGVSVSLSRRVVSDARLQPADGGAGVAFRIEPTVTSVRATVGKDLFALELLGGIGWDAVGTTARLSIPTVLLEGGGHVGEIDETRRLYFLGASRSFNVAFRLSLELGWADGFETVSGASSAFDPNGRTFFGSVALRLTI